MNATSAVLALQLACLAWVIFNAYRMWRSGKDLERSRDRIHSLLDKSVDCTKILAVMHDKGDVPFEYKEQVDNALALNNAAAQVRLEKERERK